MRNDFYFLYNMTNTINIISCAVTGVTIALTNYLISFFHQATKRVLFERANRRVLSKIITPDTPPTELPVVQGESQPLSTADISDVAIATNTNIGGVVFAENTAVVSSETAAQSTLSEAVDDIPEDLRLLKIPVKVASGKWMTSAIPDATLWTLNYNTAHLSNDRWSNVFARYVFYRYRLRVRVELNGTPFHQGKLMLYYNPGVPTQAQYSSLNNLTSLDHRPLYASYNNVQELLMPWQYHYDYARVNPNSTFVSYIALAVFNVLEAGSGGSTALNYTVWLSLEDVELKVPAPVTVPASLLTLTTQEDEELPVVQGLFDFSTTNINQTFSNIADSTLPTNITGDKFDTSLDVHGLDNPTNTLNPNPVKVRALDSLSNTTGIVENYRLALNPSKMIVPGPEYFDVADDEMSIKHLTSKWSLVSASSRTISMTSASVVGTPLYTTSINPGLLGGALPNGTTPTASYRCLLSTLSQRFSRWRGSVQFAVEIIATQYQTGKLFLGFSPYYTVPGPSVSGSPDLLTNYGMVVEINKGKNVFEVTIPFYCMNEWANVSSYASGLDKIDTDNLGYFYITPVNPLATPGSSTPNSIKLNVYVRGGDDFEFAMPFGQATAAIMPQGETIGQYRRVRGTNTYSDSPASVRDLIRRPWYWMGTSIAQVGNSVCRFALIPLDSVFANTSSVDPSPGPAVMNRLGGNLAWWGSFYRAYIGDLRLKIMLTRNHRIQGDETSGGKNAIAYNDYPVWCTHFPTLSASDSNLPTDTNVLTAVKLWLAQRYSQANTRADGYAVMPVSSALDPGLSVGINNNNASCPAIGALEEVIIDPIKAIELEIPYNGVARFATRDSQTNAISNERSTKNGYGYLLLHTWAQNTGPDEMLPYDYLWADIHVAAGDNFRFGMHTGTPDSVSCNTSTVNPIGRYFN